jgi:tRNA-2-methylthio-N6-dimethylallyladenosine synthase
MNKKTVHIKSFGCQMNKLDTALVTSALEKEGFRLSDTLKQADVVLINTCSVRNHAEQRVLSHLGHLKHIRQTRPDLVVGVIGCMAQRLGKELLQHEAVDIVCGPTQIPRVTTLVTRALAEKNKALAVTEKIRTQTRDDKADALEQFESVFGIQDKRVPNQAFVRVMRGCNKFCTYCVVPYVRGPEVSRPPTAIIEQIKKLADHGTKQVTLLGQTVNSYQYTAGEKTYCLADILEMASNVDGIQWIRFVTSYPSNKFYDEILHAMASLPKVCPYLHMPAQSGSDKILKAMNRRHTAAQYLELLDKARAVVPDIALSGDFIVGFPGESDDDFQATVDLLKRARYKNSFIFKYSPRPGTPADKKLEDTVPAEVKKNRNIELLAVQEKISDQLSRAFLGKTIRVLVEGLSRKPHLDDHNSSQEPPPTTSSSSKGLNPWGDSSPT